METNSNGINMLDVKKRNRNAILSAIFRSAGISRKELAAVLGLTPAAITLITTDLINEGLISETYAADNAGRKGRKEVLLSFNKNDYVTVGVYVGKAYFKVVCMNLHMKVLFDDTVYTADCHNHSRMIMDKIIDVVKTDLEQYDVLRKRILIGVGICVHGTVDSLHGISLNSYGIWEENVNVKRYMEAALHTPIIVSNNICALAHGESFLSKSVRTDNMLFIKYGPGVGAARLNSMQRRTIYDYQAVELGHIIVEPNGRPCICGNQGCLETVSGYDSIEQSLVPLMSEASTPILYRLSNGNPQNINMNLIMESFSGGEHFTTIAMKRAIHYLALSIRNAISLFSPKEVVLYGELFEQAKFRDALISELDFFGIRDFISFSHYDLQLNAVGPATTCISNFFEEGGIVG